MSAEIMPVGDILYAMGERWPCAYWSAYVAGSIYHAARVDTTPPVPVGENLPQIVDLPGIALDGPGWAGVLRHVADGQWLTDTLWPERLRAWADELVEEAAHG